MGTIAIEALKDDPQIQPEQIFNHTYFINNNGETKKELTISLQVPDGWKVINSNQQITLEPSAKALVIFSVQVPSEFPVGEHPVDLFAIDTQSNDTLSSRQNMLTVNEIESISLHFVEAPEIMVAGERFEATYLLQNSGNTTKNVYIDTYNCEVDGSAEIRINPGQSIQFSVYNATSEELSEPREINYTVRALLSGEIQESIFRSFRIFPSKETRQDLFFRFPVSASATYLASNRNEKIEKAWQFELQGNGALDPEGNHHLEFLARGPNNTNLSFLGMYDQYYIGYSNRNLELFVGERAYSFTPLTESSRFGMGAENKIILNNGLFFGFLWVKPRYYKKIESEIAGYSGYKINEDNEFRVHYISKKMDNNPESVQLASISTALKPFESLSLDLEYSRGILMENTDDAFRGSINSHFSIFNLSGSYFYTGKNYPGYYSNSTFYSGNVSANLTEKLSLGVYAKEDFRNAALDTFFVTAPYSKSFQTFLNYNVASRAYIKFYLREYERKDRLLQDKFHYKTRSLNTRFNHRFRKIYYSLLGEFGKTTNLLLEDGENQQETYRASANFSYRFNPSHSVRAFGSWSNVNSFITGEQRDLTAGLSVMSQIGKNFDINFYLQNAYNIDDYFRNRNLMQLNLDYTFLKNHTFSLRSFYTLFRQQTEDPEFTFSLNYSYNLGVPLKQIINAGDLKGRIIYENGEPVEGVILNLLNKTTITDENGEFWFKTVQPGRALLSINQDKMEIHEITSIPMPIEVDIIEDEITSLNFKITEGAKLIGFFETQESTISALQNEDVDLGDIIVELKNEFEEYRITTESDGSFSFPIIRPGEWNFKVYTNSIPRGYEIEKSVYNIDFRPGEKMELPVTLKSKKRNIIFKSTDSTLTPGKTTDPSKNNENENQLREKKESSFYSVQIGTFSRRISNESGYFSEIQFDFEKQIDNLH
ncbi:MAG: NEW3 domain-containing protein, partial [Prolixibacteraceae bacterium]